MTGAADHGELADRLDRMIVRATTPDRSVTAELRGTDDIRIEFAAGCYRRAAEADLERRLAQLGRATWAAREKGYRAAVEAEGGRVLGREQATDPLDRRWYDGLDSLVAEGGSSDGSVRATVRGMREWRVTIRPGTLRTLHEDQFAARVVEAAKALLAGQRTRAARLWQETYGSGSGGGTR